MQASCIHRGELREFPSDTKQEKRDDPLSSTLVHSMAKVCCDWEA